MKGYIYRYLNTINNKLYIGQTTDIVNRKSKHKGCSRTVKNKFYNAVRKYGWNNFEFSILIEIEADTIEECSERLDFLEFIYIALYDSYNNGYNSTPGGHTPRGMKRSDSYREYCKNRTYSKETRQRMSIAAKNKVVSEETREKHRQNAIKRNFSQYAEINREKAKQALSKAKSKIVLQLDLDNNIIKEHMSAKAAAQYIREFLSPNITQYGAENAVLRHCNGKIKKDNYCGFIWKYKD